jgi:hypothetical protein
MSNTASVHPDGPRWYEIRLQGQLDKRWASSFDGMSLAAGSDGTTLLRGHLADQAALHGLLQQLRDLGLPLLAVTQIENDQPHNSESGE